MGINMTEEDESTLSYILQEFSQVLLVTQNPLTLKGNKEGCQEKITRSMTCVYLQNFKRNKRCSAPAFCGVYF